MEHKSYTHMCVYTCITQMCTISVQLHGYTLESRSGFPKREISLGSPHLTTACNSMLTAMDIYGFVPQETELL